MKSKWRLNDIEAAQLEKRALAQLEKDAREILADDPDMHPHRVLLLLNRRGYSIKELERLAETENRHG